MVDSENMTELEKNFPRIVEKLTLIWGSDAVSPFLSHLLIDDRGDRKGFTGSVMADIMFLSQIHEEMQSENQPLSGQALWENPLTRNLNI